MTNSRYKEALIKIAAFHDTSAEERFKATGSYGSFDEPGSVQIAREALADKFAQTNENLGHVATGIECERGSFRAMLRSEDVTHIITDAIAGCSSPTWSVDDLKRAQLAAGLAVEDIIELLDKPPSQP